MSAAKLYTREILALATGLARWPLTDGLPLSGSARSATCGSTVLIGIACDPDGRVEAIGLQAQACAIGQASAALFAAAATGIDLGRITAVHDTLQDWLKGQGAPPDWPGINALEPARAYPARHRAILLPWQAARDALSSAPILG